jgi:hypothetical protein
MVYLYLFFLYVCVVTAQVAPPLGGCYRFNIHAGSGVTATAGATTIVYGDVGGGTEAPTGFGAAPLPHVYEYGGFGVYTHTSTESQECPLSLKQDIHDTASGATCDNVVSTEIGGLTYLPGVYCSGSLNIATTLTLDGGGDYESVFIFQATTTIITAASINIVFINGAQAQNVFWNPGTSMGIGASALFRGVVIASTSATMGLGATLHGHIFTVNGVITLGGNNKITKSEVGATDPSYLLATSGARCATANVLTSGNGVYQHGTEQACAEQCTSELPACVFFTYVGGNINTCYTCDEFTDVGDSGTLTSQTNAKMYKYTPSSVCDVSWAETCNVVTDINFQNLQSTQFVFPDTSPTVVVGGVGTFSTVIKWAPETGHPLTHTFDLYTVDTTADVISCGSSKIWNNGLVSVVGESHARSGSSQTYCRFVISDTFRRADLLDPSELYFLFNGIVTPGVTVFIDRTTDYTVTPLADTIYYLYELFQTTMSTTSTYTVIALEIDLIEYNTPDFQGIGSCDTIADSVATIDVSGCTLAQEMSDNVAGVYTFHLPKTQYDTCSDVVSVGTDVVTYESIITLPINGTGPCYYFRNGDHQQVLNIMVTSIISGNTSTVETGDVSMDVWGYDLVRCDPLLYVLPMHKSVFYINYTHYGGTSDLSSDVNSPTQYLDDINNPVTLIDTECVVHPSGVGTECFYTYMSSVCMAVFTTSDEESCVTDRFNDNVLYNLGVIITTDSVARTYAFNTTNTALENTLFNISYCESPANIIASNVTDAYDASLTARNLDDPVWGVDPTSINLFDELIVQMVVGTNDLGTSDFQITTVVVTVSDPSNGIVIAQKTFNKGDKVALHTYEWTSYYDDCHFCSWHNANNTCEAFYNPLAGGRINNFTTSIVIPRLDQVCQTGIDNSTSDYFTFNPYNWFVSPQLPFVDIDFSVVARVNLCDDTERRMLQEMEIVTIEYIELSFRQIGFTGNTATVNPTTDSPTTGSPTTDTSDLLIILGVVTGGLVGSSCCFWFILIRRRYSDTGCYYKV